MLQRRLIEKLQTPPEAVWPVLNRTPSDIEQHLEVANENESFRSSPAIPDVPRTLGWILFGTYLSLIGALALATAGTADANFALVVAALFVVAFFAVPRFIFAEEPDQGSPTDMDQFLAKGIETHTGHCSGRAALVQMLVVPVSLTFVVLAVAVQIAFSG